MLNLAAEETHILLPHLDELIFGLLAFAIILGVFQWKFWPKLKQILDERADTIEGGIERAKAVQAEAQEVLQQYQTQLAEARQEAAHLREKAKEQGAAILAEMRQEADAEKQRILEAAHAQIEADRQHALVQLRTEIGELATDLASRIVGETLSDEATQSRVVDRFLTDLEQGTSTSSDQAGAR